MTNREKFIEAYDEAYAKAKEMTNEQLVEKLMSLMEREEELRTEIPACEDALLEKTQK